MDCGLWSGYAIEMIPDGSVPVYSEPVSSPSCDQSIWATEDDYRALNGDSSLETILHRSEDGRQQPLQPLSRAGSEQSPSKMPRGSSHGDGVFSNSNSKAIGKLFFKTKLCCRFRSGTCPFVTNCNFAHGMVELRKPPPNWQEIVAALEMGEILEPNEEHHMPILTSAVVGDGQRSYKGRHCKKFYTDEGCPYGDMCSFLHDEESKARESEAISLSPAVGGGGHGAGGNGSNQKPSNWKTRICNKWEMTGHCPFGSKCHFAHGAAELHRCGRGLVQIEANEALPAASDTMQSFTSTKATADAVVCSTSLPHADVYHMGVSSQRSTVSNPKQSQRPIQKWKGPYKISRIYGDWIDDID
ncbi:hypothetical protein M5K25_002862 [Dendrobium thyrsiflorum]|uniref:C3H1-type domain-containing protein n=1 Tax=Dendrobium thyrsiflorum TaxID=117978 RepID=A0ABD0VWR0_DENTH